jgi:DNA-binding transcriptional LysR family regulator
MDLWRLHIFCKVVELKSFSKAGAAAHLSQPTVSSHIKDLENEFGCRLIDRLSKEAVPTHAGALLYRYARRMLSLRDEAETALADFDGQIKGRLLLGGSTIPGTYLLPHVIGGFIQRYPDVKTTLRVGDTANIIADIAAGLLEIGVVGAKTADKQIYQETILEDDLRLIVPHDHPWAKHKKVSLTKLLTEPFVARERGSGTLASIENSLAAQGYRLEDMNIAAELGSTEAICQGIKHHIGVSILSTLAVQDEIQAGKLKALAIDGIDLKRSFYLTHHQHRSTSPVGQAFENYLKAELRIGGDINNS